MTDMRKLFFDTRRLDAAVREKYGLSEELMMENAAARLEESLSKIDRRGKLLVLCGGGNNGADGYALARHVYMKFAEVVCIECAPAKSELCVLQKKRAESCGVKILRLDGLHQFIEKNSSEIYAVVDAVFGAGFHGSLPEEIAEAVSEVNGLNAFRVACDVPSGLDSLGNAGGIVFSARTTVAMGALKVSLFSDCAKDFTGEITDADLGVSRGLFENSVEQTENILLLEKEDFVPPLREKQNVHKGSFGHVCLVAGEKPGASVIASSASLRFGAGLVTLVDFSGRLSSGAKLSLNEDGFPSSGFVPYEIMCGSEFPAVVSALGFGMGLGSGERMKKCFEWISENPDVPVVMDADVFHEPSLRAVLEERCSKKSPTVLTPHPKEFASLLEICGFGKYSVKSVVEKRISLLKKFCEEFPNVSVILKGASVLIAGNYGGRIEIFCNPWGCSALSKAGSGDVLAGLAVSLLAQGYSPLEAAKNASLAHAFASRKISPDYSLTPFSLIKAL